MCIGYSPELKKRRAGLSVECARRCAQRAAGKRKTLRRREGAAAAGFMAERGVGRCGVKRGGAAAAHDTEWIEEVPSKIKENPRSPLPSTRRRRRPSSQRPRRPS